MQGAGHDQRPTPVRPLRVPAVVFDVILREIQVIPGLGGRLLHTDILAFPTGLRDHATRADRNAQGGNHHFDQLEMGHALSTSAGAL